MPHAQHSNPLSHLGHRVVSHAVPTVISYVGTRLLWILVILSTINTACNIYDRLNR